MMHESSQLDVLKELIFNTPELNKPKIERIKAELSAGTYTINNRKIATKWLEAHANVREPAEV